ncbi:MAG: LysR family transcriptional regulator [Paracoccaceae bacterium]|nr:LysR family transcriptional regulator [Paracoccaceae bacterium]
MDLRDLEVFRAVAEEGSVTRAAERVGRVQSAVTQRIQRLEDDLGAPLFIRDRTGMRLSAQGDVLMAYARDLLALADETRAAVADPRPRGLFRLGSMESTAAVRLPPVLSELAARFPDVRVDLTVNNPVNLSQALARGDVEAALFSRIVDTDRFDTEVVFVEDMVLVAALGQPDPLETTPDTILVFEHGCPHRAVLDRYFETLGTEPREIRQLGSYHAILGCVAAGMGVALVPGAVLSTFPDFERIVARRMPPPYETLETVLAWPKGAASPRTKALLDVLRDAGQPAELKAS